MDYQELINAFQCKINNGKASALFATERTLEELQYLPDVGGSAQGTIVHDPAGRFPSGSDVTTSAVSDAGTIELVPGQAHVYFITRNTNYLVINSNN